MKALAGAYLASCRKVKAGNQKKLSPCKYCGELFGTNERRAHEPQCPEKPAGVTRGRPRRVIVEAPKKKPGRAGKKTRSRHARDVSA